MEPHESEMGREYATLTPHPEGSLRELWTISFPLMMSFLSGNLMMFLDRLILANYSTPAMNAASAAGLYCTIFLFGGITIASIAGVFVGQFNGAKDYRSVGGPVWQMVWFSMGTAVLFIPIALWAPSYLLPEYHYETFGRPYFQWMMFFGPAFSAVAALSSFFVGLGKVRLILIATVIGNLVNVVFDCVLIFGLDGLLAPLSTKGAAIATGISQCIQLAILAGFFLNSRHREKYGTHIWKPNLAVLWKCLRTGAPNAVGHMIEFTAWATTTHLISSVSEAHLTMAAIGQSFYTLAVFGMEGLQKGVIAVTANFIGAKKWDKVIQAWRSGIKLLLIMAGAIALILLVYPQPLIALFLAQEASPEEVIMLTNLLRISCCWIWLYFIIDGMTWISVGVLTAAGDTVTIMVINTLTAWLFAVTPIYLIIVKMRAPPEFYWMLICFYGLMNFTCFYLRFRTAPWKNALLS